ncbi:MAG TPA: hypothetical protein VFR66_04130 [Burkholderiales bacterium]|nr:hypothetical protein [Burkholderiales bacterium]
MPSPSGTRRQRGTALLALAAALVLGTTWMLLSAFSLASRTAAHMAHNARILAEAKAALIAWVAANALEPGEASPGRLPCPQAWGDVGSRNEGRAAGSCASPIGWLPWRTLGLPQTLDSSGRQVWYVVSPGWHLPNSSATLKINSNTPGQLTLDGRPVIALLIAPGPALSNAPTSTQLAAGCAARVQSPALVVPPNPRDYLECYGTNAFRSGVVDNATNQVFNDQVVAIGAADLMPALEAAIAKRIERDVVPELKRVYATPLWGLSTEHAVYPFAAPFGDPATSSFRGSAGTLQGLLPFNQTQDCSGPRCLPSLVGYAATPADASEVFGYGRIASQTCVWESPDVRQCEGEYTESEVEPWRLIRIEMRATFTNVAMGLRALDPEKLTVSARSNALLDPWQPQPVTYLVEMNDGAVASKPAGSVTVTFGATLPNIDAMGWGSRAQFRIRIDRALIGDHALLDPLAPVSGWFVRNEWYRLLYYALTPSHAASAAPPRSCSTCLHVANLAPAGKQRAILILAGRSLDGSPRPNGMLADFVEGANADLDLNFEQRPVNSVFNDRIVVVDANP